MPQSLRQSRVLSCALIVLAIWRSWAVASNSSAGGGYATPDLLVSEESELLRVPISAEMASHRMETTVANPLAHVQGIDDTPLHRPPPIISGDSNLIADETLMDFSPLDSCVPESWAWQWLPAGLIYHSYMAGVHEPRMAIVAFHEGTNRTLWDATLGGRIGLLRYGDSRDANPQGYQFDFYGAAVARLDVENRQDLDSTDYVFGFPLTYGIDCWQFKFGYAHLSSHMGDELAVREPGSLDERVNYVRDSIVLGVSCYPHPAWRQYAEVGWAFHLSGGAQPWEMQFGTELAQPGPTGRLGTPFLAVHGRMREEHNYGGDVSVQAGILRRGLMNQTLRLGVHYYIGKSSQFQFFDNSEEQIGLGLWYDF